MHRPNIQPNNSHLGMRPGSAHLELVLMADAVLAGAAHVKVLADEDLSAMYLTARAQGKPRALHDHEQLELLLESFVKQVEEIVSETVKSVSFGLTLKLPYHCTLLAGTTTDNILVALNPAICSDHPSFARHRSSARRNRARCRIMEPLR